MFLSMSFEFTINHYPLIERYLYCIAETASLNKQQTRIHIKRINLCCLFEHCYFCCSRSVFGGTVGPNPQKHSNGISGSGDQPGTNSQMFYEGIKVRANPFSIPVSVSGTVQQPPSPQPAQQSLAPSVPVQRKGLNIVTKTVTPPPPAPSPDPLRAQWSIMAE